MAQQIDGRRSSLREMIERVSGIKINWGAKPGEASTEDFTRQTIHRWAKQGKIALSSPWKPPEGTVPLDFDADDDRPF